MGEFIGNKTSFVFNNVMGKCRINIMMLLLDVFMLFYFVRKYIG